MIIITRTFSVVFSSSMLRTASDALFPVDNTGVGETTTFVLTSLSACFALFTLITMDSGVIAALSTLLRLDSGAVGALITLLFTVETELEALLLAAVLSGLDMFVCVCVCLCVCVCCVCAVCVDLFLKHWNVGW